MSRFSRLAAMLAIFLLPITAAASVTMYQGFQWSHDPTFLTVLVDCAPNSECDLGAITLGFSEQFGNTNYNCTGSQSPTGIQPATGQFEFYPQTTNSVEVYFYNTSPVIITAGTRIYLAFTCEGRSFASPSPSPTPSPTPTPLARTPN